MNVQRALENHEGRSPFDTVENRVKTFESTIEKCERKGYELSIDSIRENITDIAGIRILTPFRDDIYEVVEIPRHIPGINIYSEKDYVEKPKENGYSSYHIHARIEIYTPTDNKTGTTKFVPLEIQIRDKAMDLWATVEHIVKYKNNKCNTSDPKISQQFKQMADILRDFDEHAIKLRKLSQA